MSPGGSQSEWQRRQAVQRREHERRKREQANQAKEEDRHRKQEHLAFQQRKTEEKTAAVEGQVRVLEGLLTDSLSRLPLTLQQLKVSLNIPGFDPGPLGTPRPEPKWADYAPAEPGGLSRVFGGAARYERETMHAQGRFEAAKLQHRQEEGQRRQALAAARAVYEREVADAQAKVAAQNAAIEARQAAFAQGDPEAVEWFVGQGLDGSRYPRGFPCRHQVAYRPENRDLVVEFELPSQQVVPKERGYRYVKTRDVIEAIPRPETEIKQLYAHVIACVALAR